MEISLFSLILLGCYICLTFYLSYIGWKKTKSIKGFAIGNKDMSPVLIGITMAASISSTATFVINPGFVYNHGLSAFIHYSVAAILGILVAFLLLTKKFRRLGDAHGSLTIPHFIRSRFNHQGLSLFFAFLNLLSVAFIVLILVGCSLILSGMFPISQHLALVIILLFVFSYVLMGGTYAHAYTNSFQGIMMMVIAIALFATGWQYWQEGFWGHLNSIGESYAQFSNPESSLYNNWYSVFVSGFLITFALMFQPHILTKVLYLKSDKDVNKFIITTVLVVAIFSLMLFIGFYARFAGLTVARQDAVVTSYIMHIFGSTGIGQYIMALVFVALLAAGMSTLDGILVSLSAMIVNDIYLPIRGKNDLSPSKGLNLSRWVLIAVGILSLIIAWSPPKLVGLFAQKGVYGLAAASFVPIVFGVLKKRHIPVWIIFISSTIGLVGHLSFNIFMGVSNPSVSSASSMLMSLSFAFIAIKIFTHPVRQ